MGVAIEDAATVKAAEGEGEEEIGVTGLDEEPEEHYPLKDTSKFCAILHLLNSCQFFMCAGPKGALKVCLVTFCFRYIYCQAKQAMTLRSLFCTICIKPLLTSCCISEAKCPSPAHHSG